MATGLGALLWIVAWAVLPAALVWLVITLSFRYVSLGSILAAACVPAIVCYRQRASQIST